MTNAIVHVALVVEDYDEAIEFYSKVLGSELLEDTYVPEQDKRWVLVRPRDYDKLVANGVKIVREPAQFDYGTVAVFEDLYGNLWDLIQHTEGVKD